MEEEEEERLRDEERTRARATSSMRVRAECGCCLPTQATGCWRGSPATRETVEHRAFGARARALLRARARGAQRRSAAQCNAARHTHAEASKGFGISATKGKHC